MRAPEYSLRVPPGDYTANLTISSARRWEWSFASHSVSTRDQVLVPQSRFWLGRHFPSDDYEVLLETVEATDIAAFVEVSEFWIDRTEVTQAQYELCVGEGSCTPPDDSGDCAGTHDVLESPNFPVTCVDWSQAQALCEWRGRRLPTDAEWELAARGPEFEVGGCSEDDPDAIADDGVAGGRWCYVGENRVHPWGNLPGRTCTLANSGSFVTTTGDDVCDCSYGPYCEEGRLTAQASVCDHTGNCDSVVVCPSGDCVCYYGLCLPAGDGCEESIECGGGGRTCHEGRCVVIDLREECDDDDDCPNDRVCVDSLCSQGPIACEEDRECPEGMLCCGETCVPSTPRSCQGDLVPIGSHPAGASLYGALDMAGNAREWTGDYFNETQAFDLYIENTLEGAAWWENAMAVDPTGPNGGDRRTVRGSSASSGDFEEDRTWFRFGLAPIAQTPEIGFRCAISSAELNATRPDCSGCSGAPISDGGCDLDLGFQYFVGYTCDDANDKVLINAFIPDGESAGVETDLAAAGCTVSHGDPPIEMRGCTQTPVSWGEHTADCEGGTRVQVSCPLPNERSCTEDTIVTIDCGERGETCSYIDENHRDQCNPTALPDITGTWRSTGGRRYCFEFEERTDDPGDGITLDNYQGVGCMDPTFGGLDAGEPMRCDNELIGGVELSEATPVTWVYRITMTNDGGYIFLPVFDYPEGDTMTGRIGASGGPCEPSCDPVTLTRSEGSCP